MPARDLTIDINQADNWVLRADETRTAGLDPDTGKIIAPIPEIEVVSNSRTRYFAIAPLVSSGKPSWKFGGRIASTYPFPSSGGNLDRIHNEYQAIGINRINLVYLPFVSRDFYRLDYIAPRWFKDVRLLAWQYIGEEYDYVEYAVYQIQKTLDTLVREGL